MRNVPEGFLQWCYSVMHWQDHIYVFGFQHTKKVHFESLLYRIIFVGKHVILHQIDLMLNLLQTATSLGDVSRTVLSVTMGGSS